uniref:Uncharacterized protein n=1 Tax=Glossina brevipalpis TaxID=37001 RepID=A0A1A9X4Z4_9MUSC
MFFDADHYPSNLDVTRLARTILYKVFPSPRRDLPHFCASTEQMLIRSREDDVKRAGALLDYFGTPQRSPLETNLFAIDNERNKNSSLIMYHLCYCLSTGQHRWSCLYKNYKRAYQRYNQAAYAALWNLMSVLPT